MYLLKERSIIQKNKIAISNFYLFSRTAKKLFQEIACQLKLKLIRIDSFLRKVLNEKMLNVKKYNYIKIKSNSKYYSNVNSIYDSNKVELAIRVGFNSNNYYKLIRVYKIFKDKIVKQKNKSLRLIPSVKKENIKNSILKKEFLIWLIRLRYLRKKLKGIILMKKKIIFKRWIILLIKRKKNYSIRLYYFKKFRNLYESHILNRMFNRASVIWKIVLVKLFKKWKYEVDNLNKLQYQCEIANDKNIKKLIMRNFINIYISMSCYRYKMGKIFISKLKNMNISHKNIISSYLKYSFKKLRKFSVKRINNYCVVYNHYVKQLLKCGIKYWKNNIDNDNNIINNKLNLIRKNIRKNKINMCLIKNKLCIKSKNMNEIYNIATSRYFYLISSKYFNNWLKYKLLNKKRNINMDKHYIKHLKYSYMQSLYRNINQRSIYNEMNKKIKKEILMKNFNYLQTKILQTVASREIALMASGYYNEYNLRKSIKYWWRIIKYIQLIKLKKKKSLHYFNRRSLEISLLQFKSSFFYLMEKN